MMRMRVITQMLRNLLAAITSKRDLRSYIIPNPNIPLNTNFLLIAICRPQSTGIGMITTAISNSRLNIPM